MQTGMPRRLAERLWGSPKPLSLISVKSLAFLARLSTDMSDLTGRPPENPTDLRWLVDNSGMLLSSLSVRARMESRNGFLDSIYVIIFYSSYAVYEAHPW